MAVAGAGQDITLMRMQHSQKVLVGEAVVPEEIHLNMAEIEVWVLILHHCLILWMRFKDIVVVPPVAMAMVHTLLVVEEALHDQVKVVEDPGVQEMEVKVFNLQ
jgi:hypothetical protein